MSVAADAAGGRATLSHVPETFYARHPGGDVTLRIVVAAASQAAATVTGVAVAPATGEDARWRAGEQVVATVYFSAPVAVDAGGGTPTLDLTLDGERRTARYRGGTGTAALEFAHPVSEEDDGAERARVVPGSLAANGATIRDAVGVDAKLVFELAPYVTAVAVAADPDGDGRWSAGEEITVRVAFSADVTVDTGEGTPTLGLLVTARQRRAAYAGGSGTRTLRFSYAVPAAAAAVHAVLVEADSLTAGGGTMRGAAGHDAELAHDGAARSGSAPDAEPGPEVAVVLSVADARATEGVDATLDFVVTLDRVASAPVAVSYVTVDRTARAGEDYAAARGRLTFAPGETERTVPVAVHDDAHDEGEETLLLVLYLADGAEVADSAATGTIENADPLPAAWLARFGRTAAGQVLAAVGERLRGGGQTQATVAGQRLGAADAAAVAEAQAAYERAWAQRLQEGRLREQPRALAVRDLVAGSSFSVAAAADAGAAQAAAAEPGGRWTVWGRGGWSHFAGRGDGGALQVDGDVVTATAGADYEQGAVLVGLALAYSTGSGSFDHDSDRSGTVASTLFSVHPYARLALHERLAVWGLFGYGLVGHLTLEDAAAGTMETGTGLLLGAFGVDGLLLAAAQSGGLELAARADALLLRISSAAATGLAASEADVSRWRLLLEASYAGVPLFGGVLTPAVAVGGRYDGGAAESGAGLVLSGRLSYALPAWGLTLSAFGEGLLVHEEDGLREWGAGGALRFDPGAPGRGLALSVAPSWGVAGSGAGRLWALPDAASLAPAAAQPPSGARLAAELSYGLDAPGGAGAVTPYAGVMLAADGGRTWRLGTRVRVDSALDLSLDVIRRQLAAAAEHTLALSVALYR